eukprot:NODE_43_length_33755_cov_1.178542.p8 type:complete len:371 gc:universal NODE_43_length_33755_cov_1.178542:16632-17744(+)
MPNQNNLGSPILIYADHIKYKGSVIKGYLYTKFIQILESGKIPSELSGVLPPQVEIEIYDESLQLIHKDNIKLSMSLAAKFTLTEQQGSSIFENLRLEQDKLKLIPLNLNNNPLIFVNRKHENFEQNWSNTISKKRKIIEEVEIFETTKELEDIDLDLYNIPVNTLFISKHQKVLEEINKRLSIPIETIEESKVKPPNQGHVLVQTIKFKSKFPEKATSYATMNLYSSLSVENIEIIMYFGSAVDTILNGFKYRIPIGRRDNIPTFVERIKISMQNFYTLDYESKLNIASPPTRPIQTPEQNMSEDQKSNLMQYQQQMQQQQQQIPQQMPQPVPQMMQPAYAMRPVFLVYVELSYQYTSNCCYSKQQPTR